MFIYGLTRGDALEMADRSTDPKLEETTGRTPTFKWVDGPKCKLKDGAQRLSPCAGRQPCDTVVVCITHEGEWFLRYRRRILSRANSVRLEDSPGDVQEPQEKPKTQHIRCGGRLSSDACMNHDINSSNSFCFLGLGLRIVSPTAMRHLQSVYPVAVVAIEPPRLPTMAEVLGVLASIVTMTECISKASSLVIDYYKAPAQIEHLQSSSSKMTLFRAAREKTAWLRGKSKISRLLQKLDDAQSILRVALDVSQLNSRQSFESKLSTISQHMACTQETSVSIERRIQNLERHIDSWNHSARHNNQTTLLPTTRDEIANLNRSFVGNEPGDTPPPMVVPGPVHLRCRFPNKEDPDSSGGGHDVADYRGTVSPAPASSFELSSSFFPEIYTSMTAESTLISYDLASVQDMSYARVSRCSAFYSPSPRRWLRITLLITISVDSPYWNLVRVDAADSKWRDEGWLLPKKLNASVESSLGAFDALGQDSEISFYLGPSHGSTGTNQVPKLRLETTNTSVNIKKSLLEATKMAHHWCCPRYSEIDIVKRTLSRRSKRSGSIVCIGSQWTIMTQFTACQKDFDLYFFNVQISHYLHSTPGISRLLGLVYNQDDGYLTGYLSEMATTLSYITPGRPILSRA
ncbi:uncharacterized protein PG986_005917 [Apiospora aurea]|uniref:Uncharacterized protein n=1 Tax=Apiospora aurea TaxID=335848 RepID=A0ABR1QJ42_9PEZI